MIYKPVVVLDRLPAPNGGWMVDVCRIVEYIITSVIQDPYFFLTGLAVFFDFESDFDAVYHTMGSRKQLSRPIYHLDCVSIDHPFCTLPRVGIQVKNINCYLPLTIRKFYRGERSTFDRCVVRIVYLFDIKMLDSRHAARAGL